MKTTVSFCTASLVGLTPPGTLTKGVLQTLLSDYGVGMVSYLGQTVDPSWSLRLNLSSRKVGRHLIVSATFVDPGSEPYYVMINGGSAEPYMRTDLPCVIAKLEQRLLL
jgi:hypothetical protein